MFKSTERKVDIKFFLIFLYEILCFSVCWCMRVATGKAQGHIQSCKATVS